LGDTVPGMAAVSVNFGEKPYRQVNLIKMDLGVPYLALGFFLFLI